MKQSCYVPSAVNQNTHNLPRLRLIVPGAGDPPNRLTNLVLPDIADSSQPGLRRRRSNVIYDIASKLSTREMRRDVRASEAPTITEVHEVHAIARIRGVPEVDGVATFVVSHPKVQ